MDKIVLSGKEELDIYINPQRQKLLRCMKMNGAPMTPKQISDQIGISPSAVQHHIKKLVKLGVVELSHTKMIRGITARFYYVPPKTITIGGMIEDENTEQRLAIMQNSITDVFTSYSEYCKKGVSNISKDEQYGDMLSGLIHLKPEEAKELYGLIRKFLDEHEQKGKTDQSEKPWEYALVFYPAAEEENA